MALRGRTVLMGWELGGGLGHLKSLSVVASELARHGLRPVFAVKDTEAARAADVAERFPTLPAPQPVCSPVRHAPFRAATFADILAVRGFADPDQLAALADAWQWLIDQVNPDLIICDYSPTLSLAACGAVPVVVVGTGFAVPPTQTSTFPLLDPDATPVASHEHLLDVVRQVQDRRGRPAPETLPLLFAGSASFIRTFLELDPYRSLRSEPAIGPIQPLPRPVVLPNAPRFFAYLSADYPGAELLLDRLTQSDLRGSAVLRGASDECLQRLGAAARRLTSEDTGRASESRHAGSEGIIDLYNSPVSWSAALPPATVVIHHGGIGTAEAALAAGRPQILLPKYLEQELTAAALESLGAGKFLRGPLAVETVVEAVRWAMTDRSVADCATSCAHRLQDHSPAAALSLVVNRCLDLIAYPDSCSSPHTNPTRERGASADSHR